MISGNCNRSPQQYPAMGRGAQNYGNNHHSFVHQQTQPPTLLFMAGGNVGAYSQMPPTRGYSKVNSGAPLRSTVMQCRMQQGYGGGHSYSGNPYQAFPHHYGHFNHQQPQVIPCPPQHYTPQPLPLPQPAQLSGTSPSFGFINGIKNMVKGLIQPLNCDFYTDHHKYYNPKYRNNYIRDIASEKLSINSTPVQKDSCAQAAVLMGLKVGQALAGTGVPKSSEAPSSCKNSPPTVSDVVAIFSSEDFPELPAPRRRNCPFTRANKTETTTPVRVEKVQTTAPTTRLSQTPQKESPPKATILPTPRSTFFEIKCTTTPCGRRPTFGGRLKVVPPPFSLKKSLQTCRTTSCQQESMHSPQDCDTEDESFVIFSKNDSKEDRLLAALEARRCARQRQLSECSDDSFVVFFAGDTDSLVPIDADDDDDDFDEEDDDEDSDDDDDDISSDEDEDDSDLESDDDELNNGTDVVDSSYCGRNKTDRNKCAATTQQFEGLPCADTEHEQFDSGFIENKKFQVSFDPKPVVHVMHAWNYAYRAARKGHWEDYARDRTRFQKRIERTSAYLNPILTPDHREKIYRSRFCDESAEEQPQQSQPKTMSASPSSTAKHCNEIIERLSTTTTLPEPPQCAKF